MIFHSHVNIPEAKSATFAVKKKEGPKIWWTQSDFIVIVVPQQRKENRNPFANWEPFRWCIFQLAIISHYIPLRGKLESLSHIYIIISHEINFPVLYPHILWDKLSSSISPYIMRSTFQSYIYIYLYIPHLYPISLHFMMAGSTTGARSAFSQVLLMGRAGVWSSGHPQVTRSPESSQASDYIDYMGMDQYLLIPFLGEWTSIYQLFWCSPGVQGFDTLPYIYMHMYGKLWKITIFNG